MENTTENNKLIAEFMGAKTQPQKGYVEYEMYGIIPSIEDAEYIQHFFQADEMLFQSSWDWLMPVVEKIESLGFNITIEKNYTDVMEIFNGLGGSLFGFKRSSDKIKNTHKAVVEFIKWWNNQVEIKKATK